jgi:hypothetical protein
MTVALGPRLTALELHAVCNFIDRAITSTMSVDAASRKLAQGFELTGRLQCGLANCARTARECHKKTLATSD